MPNTNNAVLACVDGSIYTDSVCAHAGWASRRLDAPVQLLHTQLAHSDYAAPRDLSGAIGLGEKSALLEKLTGGQQTAFLGEQQEHDPHHDRHGRFIRLMGLGR